MKTTGIVKGIISNLVTVEVNGPVAQNEICYIFLGETKLMAEVIKVNGKNASIQVYESTRGVKEGCKVEFEGHMFYVPRDYDKWLTAFYGDYMTLPPEEKRRVHYNDTYQIED